MSPAKPGITSLSICSFEMAPATIACATSVVVMPLICARAPIRSTEMGSHTGQEFGETEGLGDVVGGARVEADDHVHLLGTSREHEDREAGPSGQVLAGDVEAVAVGQAEVQKHQIWRLGHGSGGGFD